MLNLKQIPVIIEITQIFNGENGEILQNKVIQTLFFIKT